jgi:hypothetical protein
MAFIPSIKLSAALANASTGLWIEQLGGGRIALVCKMPETVIKALYRGASSTLLLAVIQAETLSILCLGLRINDEPDNPFSATMPNPFPDDVALLTQILESKSTTLHCLDELNHPALSAWCSLEPHAAQVAAEGFKSSNHWLLTPSSSTLIKPSDLSRVLELSLDLFQRHIYRSPDAQPEAVEVTAEIALTLDIWKPTEIYDVTPTIQSGPFRIDDDQEGPKLERLVRAVVDSLYPGSSYRSPSVQDGKVRRELADVLGFDSDSICAIQGKAMSVLTVDSERSSKRRSATVTKHITKALKQLAGSLTHIRSASPIFDADGEPIHIPNQQTSLAQAIVVLSEMYAFVDWKAVASAVAAASENDFHRAFFHVVDLREITQVAAHSKDAETFNRYMVQRWVAVKEKGTAYGRAKLPQ